MSQNTLRLKVLCDGPPMADVTGGVPVAAEDAASIPLSSEDEEDAEEKDCLGCEANVKRYFYLKNVGLEGLVMDVEGMNRNPRAPVILWDQKFSANYHPDSLLNQLWYEDTTTATIRTAMNDFCLDLYGDQLVVNCYEPDRATQRWSIDGSLVRWCGGPPGDWQVVGMKPPIGGQHCYLHVGPLDTLIASQWSKEFVYIGSPRQQVNAATPFVTPWIKSYLHCLRKEIVQDLSQLVSPLCRNGSAPETSAAESQVVHRAVTCDVCDQPIIGVRYKCGFCHNYDLCSACEKRGADVHDPSHVLLKMTLPCSQVRLSRACVESVLGRCISPRVCDGHFVSDETYPDGSCVGPGVTLHKTWIMRNVGSVPWTPSTTKLKHSHGSLLVDVSEVSVSYTAPGDESAITVQLCTPRLPGRYTSTWRLYDMDTKSQFGPRIWCSVTVVPASCAALPVVTMEPWTAATGNSGVDVGLSTEDLFAFVKTLEMTAAKKTSPWPGPLTVPTNTPLAATPPLYRADFGLSRVSSSGSVSSLANDSVNDTGLGLDIAVMADLVQEKMSDLSAEKTDDMKESTDDDTSDGGNDDDDDDGFCVIPLPDCFNMDLPPSKTATMSLVVKKPPASSALVNDVEAKWNVQGALDAVPDTAKWQRPQSTSSAEVLVDSDSVYCVCCSDVITGDALDMVRVDHETEPVPDGDDEYSEAEVVAKEADSIAEEADTVAKEAAAVADKQITVEDNELDEQAAVPSKCTTADHSDFLEPPESPLTEPPARGADADEHLHDDDDDDDSVDEGEGADETDDAETVGELHPEHAELTGHSSGSRPASLASSILGTAVVVAGKAASAAYSTAKDVYYTLQARNAYAPPSSNWTPPVSNWTPPQSNWSPHDDAWTPRENDWIPPPPWSPAATDDPDVEVPRTPMELLIEMGFADRRRNQELLETYGADMQRVIQELVDDVNGWYMTRH